MIYIKTQFSNRLLLIVNCPPKVTWLIAQISHDQIFKNYFIGLVLSNGMILMFIIIAWYISLIIFNSKRKKKVQ